MPVGVNPSMVTLARESRRLTQSALATALGVSQATISKLEHGTGGATDELVEGLARVLGYAKSFFTETLQPHELPPVFYRKKSRVAAVDIKAIRARMNIVR